MDIVGKKTILRKFCTENLEDPNYLRWLRDPEVMKYIARDEYYKEVDYLIVKSHVEKMLESEFCYYYAIFNLVDNTFIGTCKIDYIDENGKKNSRANVGIMIGERSCWGSGFGKDVINSLSKFAFNELGVRKLIAGALRGNVGSIAIFKKNGYKEEGVFRLHTLTKAGEYVDHVYLACFPGELVNENQ